MPLELGAQTASFLDVLAGLTPSLLIWGWLFVLFLVLWLSWEAYKLLKQIEYSSSFAWTYLEVKLPSESEYTPKAMENAIAVWAGLHKTPDLIELFFEGYMFSWYSLEIHCEPHRARYIMVVPTVHRQFFEGVVYGQYPTAEITEVEDYTLRFDWRDLGKTFDMYGTEFELSEDAFYPIRTYLEFEDTLAPEDHFIDPHQAMIEAYTNIKPGEEYWFQICVKPIHPGDVKKWSEKGEEEVARISGQVPEESGGIVGQIKKFFMGLPGEVLKAAASGPVPIEEGGDEQKLRFFNPVDDAKMRGILQKISREVYLCKIRIIYLAPKGQIHKPNVGRAIGVFKQFSSFTMNSLKPSPEMKTNGPNYIMKYRRRRFREKRLLSFFQWRDHFGNKSGELLTAEEIATLYHFPAKWVKAPVIARAKAGLEAGPEDLPYI